jgi:hypothetical protein
VTPLVLRSDAIALGGFGGLLSRWGELYERLGVEAWIAGRSVAMLVPRD